MAGSTPSGRRSRRRSGKRPSSPLTPNNSRSNSPRQSKGLSKTSQGPLPGNSSRPTRAIGGSRSRRQKPSRSPHVTPSAASHGTSGSSANAPNSRLPQPSKRMRQSGPQNQGFPSQGPYGSRNVSPSQIQGQPGYLRQPNPSDLLDVSSSGPFVSDRSVRSQPSLPVDPVNSYYTTPYPTSGVRTQKTQAPNQFPGQSQGQISSQIHRSERQYSQDPIQGQGSSAIPQSHQIASPSHTLRQPSNSPHEAAPSAVPGRNPRDIRLGPDVRRRPQLSSNPAFGRTRSTPRSGGGGVAPPVIYQPYSAPNNGPQLQPHQSHQSVDALQVGVVEPRVSGVSTPAQPRTQRLQPRPVSRRTASRRARDKRTRIRPPRSATVSAAAIPLPFANEHPEKHQHKKAVSPLVYGIRLLILGVGLGAIAGTLISALDPSSVVGQTDREKGISLVENNDISLESNGADAESDSPGAIESLGRPTVSPNAISFNAIPKRAPYAALNSQLQTMANNQPELTPGVFALDLDSYNYVDLNGSTTFSAASIIKVPILVAFFQDVEQNKIQLDETLVMQEQDVAGGSGNMRLGKIGDQYSALETARKMIVISDNTATNMLIRRMGGIDHLNRRFRSWGLTATALRNPLPDLEGTNTTSPSEMTHLMTLISQGKLLEAQSREQMLDIMYQTETATLLPAGIGGNAEIAHKTGDIGSMVGDTGLVDTASGKRYAVTIMMRRPHNDSRAQELIRQMAGVIHRALQTPSTPTVSGSSRSQSASQSQTIERSALTSAEAASNRSNNMTEVSDSAETRDSEE